MTTFAQHRAALESFLDCVQGGAGKDAIAGCLAENVVLIGPLSDEPLTGREAVAEAIQTVHTLAAHLTYEEVLSGETHHGAFFRRQIEDTVVNGMDYALLAPEPSRHRDAGLDPIIRAPKGDNLQSREGSPRRPSHRDRSRHRTHTLTWTASERQVAVTGPRRLANATGRSVAAQGPLTRDIRGCRFVT